MNIIIIFIVWCSDSSTSRILLVQVFQQNENLNDVPAAQKIITSNHLVVSILAQNLYMVQEKKCANVPWG